MLSPNSHTLDKQLNRYQRIISNTLIHEKINNTKGANIWWSYRGFHHMKIRTMSKGFMSYQLYVERNKEYPETYGVLMAINV